MLDTEASKLFYQGGMNQIRQTAPYFFQDKPLFGMDIGRYTLRVMQLELDRKVPGLKGYGAIEFDAAAIKNGVIVKPELIAKPAVKLFSQELIGDIATKRVAIALPASRALTRAINLPPMSPKDIAEAVKTEIDQYIPTADADNFYLDYTLLHEGAETIEVFAVAIPKQIVDSYLTLTSMMGLEAVSLNTTIGASAKLFAQDKQSDIPSVLVDFGSKTTDITIFNQGIVATGSVEFGGDDLTDSIAKMLAIKPHDAIMLKSKYGLSAGRFQKQIKAAMEPSLELLTKEFRRTIRYYEQRYAEQTPIGQIVIMGGGANMPGLADYLTERLRLPARTFYMKDRITFGRLRQFYSADNMSFVTVAGLAMTEPAEIFV
ncbi:MAG: pilus assembly protein PilM [Candidatus Saccharimonadales bacterium]